MTTTTIHYGNTGHGMLAIVHQGFELPPNAAPNTFLYGSTRFPGANPKVVADEFARYLNAERRPMTRPAPFMRTEGEGFSEFDIYGIYDLHFLDRADFSKLHRNVSQPPPNLEDKLAYGLGLENLRRIHSIRETVIGPLAVWLVPGSTLLMTHQLQKKGVERPFPWLYAGAAVVEAGKAAILANTLYNLLS